MTALGLLLSLALLVVMSVREVRRVGADVVGTTTGGWLLRAELLLVLACGVLVLPRAIGLLT
jgi:hypothetical protein